MRRMCLVRDDVSQAKFGLLMTVMVGILAVSVALAWLTTKPHEDNSQGGAEIVSKLADDTLEGYWTGSRRTSWFIGLKQDGKPVGWQMRSRDRESDGVFSGSLAFGSTGSVRYDSSWLLSPDLSVGHYFARVFLDRDQAVETRITLTDSKVTVVRGLGGKRITATAARPRNYVPEGALPVALRLVAARGEEVTVKMIFDNVAIVGGTVNFVNVNLSPLGDKTVRVRSYGQDSGSTTVYHLDSNHDIESYEYPDDGVTYHLSKKEIVTRAFRIADEEPAIKAEPPM